MTRGGIDGYQNFLGDDEAYKEWYGVRGRSRDSDMLEESNFDTALKMLGGEGDNVLVASYGHWAVGWIEEIYVKPNTKEYAIALEIEKSLANYPVLDDVDFSNRQFEAQEEAIEGWAYEDFKRWLGIKEVNSRNEERIKRAIRDNMESDVDFSPIVRHEKVWKSLIDERESWELSGCIEKYHKRIGQRFFEFMD